MPNSIMIIRVQVFIEAEPQDGPQGNYGSMNFNESTTIRGKTFSAIAGVFSRVHDLMEQVKKEFS